MQKRTVSRPPLSLARVSSPLATLPQRKSRHTSRVWPARERLCWSRGSRNRRSSSSAWSCRCSLETLIRLTAGWPNKRSQNFKKQLLGFFQLFLHGVQAFLGNQDVGDSLDGVEVLVKKHEDFEKSLLAQEEKVKAVDDVATRLLQTPHYAAEDIDQRRKEVCCVSACVNNSVCVCKRKNELYQTSDRS